MNTELQSAGTVNVSVPDAVRVQGVVSHDPPPPPPPLVNVSLSPIPTLLGRVAPVKLTTLVPEVIEAVPVS